MMRRIPFHMPAVISLGAVCQIGQILLLREFLMVFHGNELTLGIVLAAWMTWVGVGSQCGAALVERCAHPVRLLAHLAIGVFAMLPVTLVLIRGLRGFFDVLPGTYLPLSGIAISCFLLMAPVCLLLGAHFVLLARIWRESDRVMDTSASGKTYIGEAAGNILGGLSFTFILVHLLNAFQLATLSGMLLAGAALWLMQKEQAENRFYRYALAILLTGSALILPFLDHLDTSAYRLQWRFLAPDHELVATHQSRYGTISVARRENQYSFFQSGHLIFSTAGTHTPVLEEQEAAIFAHFSLVQHQNPRRILLIGGGLRGTLREIALHPVARIDYLELDEVLMVAARPHLPAATLAAMADPRVHLKHLDGRFFVKTSHAFYDMILVDVPDPATAVLNRYYTEEFFREVRQRLHPDGVLVIGALSTPDLRGSAIANRNATLYHTLKRVFDNVLPVGARFMFFFASRDSIQISADANVLRQRFLKRNIQTDAFSPRQFDLLLQETSLRRINWIIRHHGRRPDAHLAAPESGPLFPGSLADIEAQEKQWPPVMERTFINSDFRPVGYFYTLAFWDALTGAAQGRLFYWIGRANAWWLVPGIGLCLLTVLVLRHDGVRRRHRGDMYFAVLCAVFTTGFSTMALLVALLFAFQSTYGFVYEMVGLIAALFMFGLLLGTALVQRRIVRMDGRSAMRTLVWVQFLIAVLAGLIGFSLLASTGLPSPGFAFVLFSALTFSAGFMNGLDFPLATASYHRLNTRADRATGAVYGVELFGACAGAALAGLVIAPVYGIVSCCLMAGIANAMAFAVLVLSRRTYA